MSKTKMDERKKIKLIYSGELIFFAIVFLVIGIVQLSGVWKVSDRMLNIFSWITIFGAPLLILDLVWALVSRKRRYRVCVLDKILLIPSCIYILIIDILLFKKSNIVWDSVNRQYFIPSIFIYLSAVYIFQAIYHWYHPINGIFDQVEKKDLSLKEISLEKMDVEYPFVSTLEWENGFENRGFGLSEEEYKKFVLICQEEGQGKNLKPGYVPQTVFILYDKDVPVGIFKVRHYLTEALANGGGHIGYGIGKQFRGKGYGKYGLELAIKALKMMPDFKENEVYMSCNLDNIGSLKVQLANGAYIHHKDDKENYTRIKVRR